MDAIVCSQFPEVELADEAMIQTLSSSVDLHIGGAILFALIGFSLVSGIEIAGKIIGQKK